MRILHRDRYDDLGFEQNLIVPAQLLCKQRTGESRLQMAVLECAWHDLTHYDSHPQPWGRQLYEAAVRYFAADDWDHPFSFVSVCWHFGLDPDWVRRRMPQERPGRVPKALVPRIGMPAVRV